MSAGRVTGAVPRPAAEADARMTAERDEVKYLVARRRRCRRWPRAMSHQLPPHRFTGEGANALPRPRHFVTTIYFDTPSRHQFRASRADADHNLKMRAKEYYDLHPSLAELATDRPADRQVQAGAVAGAEVQGRQPHRQAAHRHPQAAGARLLRAAARSRPR